MPLTKNKADYETKTLRHIYAFIAEEKDSINQDDYSINFVISSDVIDRAEESVRAEGVFAATQNKDEFWKNPAALPCHLHRLDSGMPPSVGHWEPGTARLFKHHCEMRLFFARGTILGDEYWKYYSGRHMRAVSIGFRIKQSHWETVKKLEVLVIDEIELIEISCVAVGMNPEAVSKMEKLYSLDGTKKPELNPLDEKLEELLSQKFEELAENIALQLDEIKSLIIPDPDGFARELLLGGALESSASAGLEKPERIINKMKKTLSDLEKKLCQNQP